ncbi:MAG: hypothetical protein GF334_00950 [Candidatus Altiarchaeales archaeon]|nr:hypothetical protein [Candidatus Altiarchaeales archaeon]
MSLAAPTILYPMTDWVSGVEETYSSSDLVQMISGEIPVVVSEIDDETMLSVQYRYKVSYPGQAGTWSSYSESGITVGATSTAVIAVPWSLNTSGIITLVDNATLNLQFKTIKRRRIVNDVGPILGESSVSSLVVNIIDEDEIEASSQPPTGVDLKRAKDSIKIRVPANGLRISGDGNFAGCNFYLALEPGGGEDGYALANSFLITDPDSAETVTSTIEESETEDSTNDITITTTRDRTRLIQYYTLSITKTVLRRMVNDGSISDVFLADGQSIDRDRRFYLVATLVTYDQVLNEAVESPYSFEQEGQFVDFQTQYLTLPSRSRTDVLFSISQDIFQNNELVSVIPGSVLRDISDPVATEFERFYVIQDFLFACLSVDTLLQFDDANGDGISDSLEENVRKRKLADALTISSFTPLQNFIDQQFNKMGSNYDLTRKGSQKARGTVTFYMTQRPTEDIIVSDGTTVSTEADVDAGTQATEFLVQGSKILDADNPDPFYNPDTKRYEITANIEARFGGTAGNVPAGTITIVTGLNPLLRVENNSPTLYGSNTETNARFATRIKMARASYDSGTETGYASTSNGVPGVLEARVEKEDDPLMMRDYDEESKKHIGGKVDIYVRGESITQVVDQVAFRYEYPTDTFGNKVGEQFYVTNSSEYRIRTKNPNVGSESPIVIVHSVRNVTRNSNYSLDGLRIIGDGDTILLDANLTNQNIGMAALDVIMVDYRYRSSNELILSEQPVIEVVSVTDTNDATIDSSKYELTKSEDILQNGESTIAKDSVKFYFNDSDNINELVSVENEEKDMLINVPAKLNLKGVDIDTIVVKPDNTGTGSAYRLNVDYTVTPGSVTTYTYISLKDNGMIRNGDRVYVDYEASENFNVTYTVNNLLSQVQDAIDSMKHACADTIVKNAVGNYADFAFKVVAKTGTDKTLLKSRVQTALANLVGHLKMGDTLTQGAVINAIVGVKGAKEIQMPITRMMKRNSSYIVLDDIGETTFEIYQKTSRSGVTSYRSVNSVLTYKTSDGGGDSNLYRAVYENNIPLTLVDNASLVSSASGSAYIQSDGRIIVSTTDGLPPQSKSYKATYYTFYPADENVVQDIETAQIEYLRVDSLSLKGIEIVDETIVKRGL